MKARVLTILTQELEVPEGTTREEIFDFLGEYQSFRTAFQGVDSLDGKFRIEDIVVVEERVEALGEEAYDD